MTPDDIKLNIALFGEITPKSHLPRANKIAVLVLKLLNNSL
jgi:hypothetical protein